MQTCCEKYGMSSWNAERLTTAQDGVPPGYKRCSKVLDPRCVIEKGIHLLTNYRIQRPYRPTPQTAYCKFCESFMASKRHTSPERIGSFKEYQKQYSKEKYTRMRYDNGFQILYDPSKTYERNRLFGRQDFKQSLKEGVWPQHLVVRDLKTGQCCQVNALDLEEIKDRNWFEFRKEQVIHGKNIAD